MARRFLTAAAAGRRRYVSASTPWHSRGSKRHLFLTASISRHQAAGAGFGHRRGHGTAPSALPGDHSKDLLMYSLHRKTIAASLAAAAIAGAPNGDFFMADRDIRIVKVDDVTGNQTTIKAPEFNTSNLVDLVVAAD